MADKEPRRRKKNRRDSQKKDDVRSEDHQFFLPTKTEPRDSDQDAEEEPVIHGSHQPSNVAKIVFVILFSGLVVSLSVIFISLRDVKDSPMEVLDMGHEDHHGEALHDEHIEDALHDDHDDHDEHEVSFEDILPSLSSILSLNQEAAKEIEEPPTSEDIEEAATDIEEEVISHTAEPEILMDQGILEEYIEDTPPPDIVEEPQESTVYPDTSTYIPYTEDESIFTTSDYSDFPSSSVAPDEAESSDIYDAAPPTMDDDDDDQDTFSMYERADITNEADFDIREQLDEIDEMLAKASNNVDSGMDENDDDDDDDDDEDDDENKNGNEEEEEDDDDDEEEEEGGEEEFDFWQF